MAFIYKDWHEVLPSALHEYCTSVNTSTGATPSFIHIHHEGHASRGGRSPVDRSSAEIQALLNLNAGRFCTTIAQEDETRFQQEGSSP